LDAVLFFMRFMLCWLGGAMNTAGSRDLVLVLPRAYDLIQLRRTHLSSWSCQARTYVDIAARAVKLLQFLPVWGGWSGMGCESKSKVRLCRRCKEWGTCLL